MTQPQIIKSTRILEALKGQLRTTIKCHLSTASKPISQVIVG